MNSSNQRKRAPAPPRLRLQECLAARWPASAWQDVTVAAAVSGGADSVALLRGLRRLRPSSARGSIVVLHFDHQLRPGSAEDAQFVRELAGELGLRCDVGSPPATAPAIQGETAARDARYAFFHQAASELGARYLATAHTADDQAETVLHRIVRGTGLQGLGGIPFLRPLNEMTSLIRPLLDVAGDDAREFLRSLGQPWREDPTNATREFTRNRLRHELLPQLETYNPEVRSALRRLGALAAEHHQLVESLARQLLARAVRAGDDPPSKDDVTIAKV